jgi:hypothetical protein
LALVQIPNIAPIGLFGAAVAGYVPASGGGTVNYLRADGAWSPPAEAGNLLRVSFLTSGTSLTAQAGTTFARARIWAGSGGGGGVADTAIATQGNVAGGGAAGGYAEFATSTIPASWSYAIGAAGAAGASGGGTGGVGGNSTCSDGATTVTANGGPGGVGDAADSTSPHVVAGGAPPSISTNGSANGSGAPGNPGLFLGTGGGLGGAGGFSAWGGAGDARRTTGAGNNATAYASGGGGALELSAATANAGGVGFQGIIVLEEFG